MAELHGAHHGGRAGRRGFTSRPPARGGASWRHHGGRAGRVADVATVASWRRTDRRPVRLVRRAGSPAHLRQLPPAAAAARLAAPRVRSAGARRAAVHHHPPGLRAVVQAAAARGGRRAGRDVRGPGVVGPAPAAAGARDRAGAGAPGRRAGDDDAAGLPGVPAAAGAGQRLPVGAVPGAGVHVGRQGPVLRRPVQGADREASRPGCGSDWTSRPCGTPSSTSCASAGCRPGPTRRSASRWGGSRTTGSSTPTCGP